MSWLLLVLLLASGKQKAPAAPPSSPSLSVKGTAVSLEIANSDTLRAHGLSDRRKMEWNHGMLFVFPEEDRRTFWMFDCYFDLDVAFMDHQGIVRDIQAMPIQPGVAPEMLARYTSNTTRAMYALEMNRGWFSAHGVRVGDTLVGLVKWTTFR